MDLDVYARGEEEVNQEEVKDYFGICRDFDRYIRKMLWIRSPFMDNRGKNIASLAANGYSFQSERNSDYYSTKRRRKIREKLPKFLRHSLVIELLKFDYENKGRLGRVGREENFIDLWVNKLA